MRYTSTVRTLLVVVAAAGLLSLTACDETIDKDPEQSIPIDDAFENVSAAESALTGAYDGLQQNGVFGGFMVPAADFTADIADFGGSFTTWQQAENFTVNSTHGPTANIWADHYDVINRANLVIDNTPDVPDITDEKVNELVGQAKFIRALAYFNLVRWFGQPFEPNTSNDQPGVVLATEGIATTEPEFDQPRASVGDVYSQIVNDLQDAISRLEVEGARKRAGQGSAEALLAKVRLYQASDRNPTSTPTLDGFNTEFGEAARDLANTVISRGEFQLSDDITAPYSNEASSEIVFAASFSSIDNTGVNDFPTSFYLPSDLGGRGDITPIDALFEGPVESGDLRADPAVAGPAGPGEINGDALIYTFADEGPPADNWTNKWTQATNGDDYTVLRVAEMYLIRAEARARLGDEPGARQDVNAIRNRAGLSNVDPSLSGQDLIDEIIRQRKFELAFEADRRHDLQRLGRDITSGTATVTPDGGRSFQRILPIPDREIEVNQAFDESSQNPGY